MKRLAQFFVLVLLLSAAFAGGVAWRTFAGVKKQDARRPLYYQDPMHPWYRSDKPGIAPDCGMKLEPVYRDGAAPKETRKPLYYRDPKQHAYRADSPGINPETGNDLEPVYDDTPANALPVAADRHELLGLTFGQAEETAITAATRATGRVAVDETRVVRVHSKTEGWIEKTFVAYTGALVHAGDPLLTLYSPELLASQQELLLALKARDSMHHSSMTALQVSGDSLVEAARRRLALWDLSPARIAEIEQSGTPLRTVTIYSPADGYVLEREAFPNQKIAPDTKLYTLADLSRVWVFADVFETDAASLRTGSSVRISGPAVTGTLRGTVSAIQPVVDSGTRTLKARIELPNPGYRLRPEMWVDVDIQSGTARRLTVPAQAVIDSGDTQIIYVDRGNGNLEPRRVTTGARSGDRVEILSGLTPSERIVTSGAFLLNSESQMRSSATPSGHEHD